MEYIQFRRSPRPFGRIGNSATDIIAKGFTFDVEQWAVYPRRLRYSRWMGVLVSVMQRRYIQRFVKLLRDLSQIGRQPTLFDEAHANLPATVDTSISETSAARPRSLQQKGMRKGDDGVQYDENSLEMGSTVSMYRSIHE